MEVSSELRAPAALHQVTSPRYPLILRLGGPLRVSEGFVQEILVNHLLPAESRLSSPKRYRCTDCAFPAKY